MKWCSNRTIIAIHEKHERIENNWSFWVSSRTVNVTSVIVQLALMWRGYNNINNCHINSKLIRISKKRSLNLTHSTHWRHVIISKCAHFTISTHERETSLLTLAAIIGRIDKPLTSQHHFHIYIFLNNRNRHVRPSSS